MKIAIDARIIKPWLTGLGRYGFPLLHALAQIDKKNEYIILKSPLITHPLICQENFREISLPGTPEDMKNYFCHLKVLDGENVDLFHSLYHFLPRSVAAKKTMITLHDLIWVDNPHLAYSNSLTALAIKYWALLFIGRTVAQADAIICISQATQRALEQRYQRTQNVHMVYHGTDLIWHTNTLRQAGGAERDVAVPLQLVEGHPRTQHPVPLHYFLMVGHTKPYKNAPAAIEALALLLKQRPDAHLVFVGRGDNYKTLKIQSSKFKVQNSVHFISQVNDADLKNLYQNATALLQPSLTEGFGAPVLEAMKNACPVIVSNRDSLPELVQNCGLVIDPEKPLTMAVAMQQLLSNKNLRDGCISAGKKRAAEFRWETTAQKTLAIYQSLL